MDEYIKREDVMNAICMGCNEEFSEEPCEPDCCAIRQAIKNIPTADVLEEYKNKVYRKMEKYTVFGREYIHRIMREVKKEMVGDKDV